MFNRFRKEKVVLARILDTPLPMIIESESITAPVPDDDTKILIIRGQFKHISDADAYLKVRTAFDKLGIA